MTVTQYIGARYVPLFAGDWDSSQQYEPLSIVLYQGNSYTSVQAVPAGIAITNTEYWAQTGNYNAQVEAYRQEVRGFDSRITQNASDISAEETAREAADTALQTSFESGMSAETAAREAADSALASDVETISEQLANTVKANHVNWNVQLNLTHVHTINQANESFQSMQAYNGYIYVASYDDTMDVIIRKYDIDFNLLSTYRPNFKCHCNSMAIYDNKIYLVGVYHDGSVDYGQVGVYDIADNASTILDFSNFSGVYNLQVFASNHGVSFFGITNTGVFFQMLKSPITDKLTLEWCYTIPEVNGISQDSFVWDGVYYQLIGSRYNRNNAAPNCMIGYRYNGEFVNCTTFVQDETGNNYPYNELEGITYLDNKLYAISMRGLIYTADYYPLQLPDVNGITRFRTGIMNVFGFGNKYEMNGNLMEKLYCNHDFTSGNLSALVGAAQIAGHIVPIVYNTGTAEISATATFPWSSASNYITTWYIKWARSTEQDTYVYTVSEITMSTNYGGTWVTYDSWDEIEEATFGNKTVEIRELIAIYNGNPHWRIDA